MKSLTLLVMLALIGCDSHRSDPAAIDFEPPGLNNPVDPQSNNSDEEVIFELTFEDFRQFVINSATDDAIDCGFTEPSDSVVAANTCAAESFNLNQPFYAIYRLQGIDSTVGEALTSDGTTVSYWHYDSNPAGGAPPQSGVIEGTLCNQAALSGSLDGEPREVFYCD